MNPAILRITAAAAIVLLGASLEAQSKKKEEVPRLFWNTLRGLDVDTGKMNDELRGVVNKPVRILGFMVPFDDDATSVTEFLLVPFQGACIHVPAPPPNQIVDVKTPRGRRVRMDWDWPVWVEGKLEAVPTESPYGSVSFRIHSARVTEFSE